MGDSPSLRLSQLPQEITTDEKWLLIEAKGKTIWATGDAGTRGNRHHDGVGCSLRSAGKLQEGIFEGPLCSV